MSRRVARALAVANYVENPAGAALDVGPGFPVADVSGEGQRAQLSGLALADGPGERTRPGEIVGTQVDACGHRVVWVRLDGSNVEVEVSLEEGARLVEGEQVHVDFARARADVD